MDSFPIVSFCTIRTENNFPILTFFIFIQLKYDKKRKSLKPKLNGNISSQNKIEYNFLNIIQKLEPISMEAPLFE